MASNDWKSLMAKSTPAAGKIAENQTWSPETAKGKAFAKAAAAYVAKYGSDQATARETLVKLGFNTKSGKLKKAYR